MALIFTNVRDVDWIKRGTRPATDATGELDWGNIDTFVGEGGRYELSGDGTRPILV